MDYNDNDYQCHLAGEDSSKVSSVLHPYALPKFDFDDSLQGHLRFDSLVENEVFLGIPSQEDNQWIEDFSRGSSGIEFSSSAADSCSIPRRNNVWSEATSTESVEMLLKSVGQEELVPGDSTMEESDAGNELGCLIQPTNSSLKLDDKRDDVNEPGSIVPMDKLVESTDTLSRFERTDKEGIHIDCVPETQVVETQVVESSADGCSDVAGVRCTEVDSEEMLQTEIKRVENLGLAKTSLNESPPDESVRHPSLPIIGSSAKECLSDSPPVDADKLDCQDNLTKDHSGDTGGLPSEHDKPEEKHIFANKESSLGNGALFGSAATSEISNASPPSFATSEREVIEDPSTKARATKLEEPCVRKNEHIPSTDGFNEDAYSVQHPEVSELVTAFSEGLEDNLRTESESILCEDEDASVNQRFETQDTKNPENSSNGQSEKVPGLHISDGQNTFTQMEESNLDGSTPLNCGTSEACLLSEHAPLVPSIIQEASVSTELLVERPVPENLETGNDADSFSRENACAGDGTVSLSVPSESVDIHRESFSHVGDVDTTNEAASGCQEKEEVLPVEDESLRSCQHDHAVRSSCVGEEPEKFIDKDHKPRFESSMLNEEAPNPGFGDRSLSSGGESVHTPLLSCNFAIASKIVDRDDKSVSVVGGPVQLSERDEMEVVPSAVTEESSQKVSSWVSGQVDPISTDGIDASGDHHKEIAPMIVDENVPSQHNPDTTSHVEKPAVTEVNSESCRQVEACAINSSSTIKESDGGETAAGEKNQETKVETVKLSKVGDEGSSDVTGGVEHSSTAVVSGIAFAPSEEKITESKSRAVIENVDTVDSDGKAQSSSSEANASSKADTSLTFDVSPLTSSSKGKDDKSVASMQACQLTKLKAGDGVHLESGSKQTATKMVQEIAHGSPLVSDKVTPSGGAKQTATKMVQEIAHGSPLVSDKVTPGGAKAERKGRRGPGKSGKENAKKGNHAPEINALKQSDRGDQSSLPFSPSATVQRVQLEPVTVDRGIVKSGGVVAFPTSSLPDLNTSSPASVLFHQPFTDLQQVQLRAQIFVYGSLIQGVAPEEACMISAFGTSEGSRNLWDPAWRTCVERTHGQRSNTGNSETPSHSRSGPRTPDQGNKQTVDQNKVTTPAAGKASSKASNSSGVSSIIPLSSPLWNMPTPTSDGLPSNGMARGAIIDYKTLSPMHPYQASPVRNFVGHTGWLPQAPFPGPPWVASPPASAFDVGAQFSALPVTEPVKLTPVKESSSSVSAGAKFAAPASVVLSGDSGNLGGASPHNKKASALPPKASADQKSRKRKKPSSTEDHAQISLLGSSSKSVPSPAIGTQLSSKALASDDFGQSSTVVTAPLVAQSHAGSASPVVGTHFSTSVVVTPSSSVPKNSSDLVITSNPSSNELLQSPVDLGKKTLTSEDLSKVDVAMRVAEEAAAEATATVSHCQDVWSQLDKHKNSDLASDIEFKMTSAAVAIAAAASVAKAAAAAAKIASNAATQAKLMAEEAFLACGTSNPSHTNAASSPNIVSFLGRNPGVIMHRRDVSNGSGSVLSAAREAARRKIEAASAASRHAENLDAIVKAAGLAYEAVSHAGKAVAMAELLPISQLVEAGPESYWKVSDDQGANAKVVNGNEELQPVISACEPVGEPAKLIEVNVRTEEDVSTPITGRVEGRSMQEASKTVGLTAESKKDSRLSSQDLEACGDVGSSKMQEGSLVEVFKDTDDGKRAWYSAKVLASKNGKVLVCYTDHQTDEGSEQLKDWVSINAGRDEPPRVRPAHPATALQGVRKRQRASVKEYTWYVGDRVDAWIDYRWREGVIAEKNKRDETTVSVNFPAYGDTAVVRAWHLRPTLIWKDGEWVEWSRSRHDFLSQGDTPKGKRVKLGNPTGENAENESLSKKVNPLVPVTNEPAPVLPLSVSEKSFNIGSTNDDTKLNALRTMRSGLQKEGSKVFGVPKPGKKRKFMEVSKHYVSDKETKSNTAHDPAKLTKYLMPQTTGVGGWKNSSRTDPKDKQVAEAKQRPPRPNRFPSSARNLKDKSFTSTGGSSLADRQPGGANRSSTAEEGAEGHEGLSSDDAPANVSKKASTSRNREERPKRYPASANVKSNKTEEKDKLTPDVNEPRRSNRKIQPTSRLLEGLQSSLIISKFPLSHDKGQRSHSRGSSR